MTKPLWDHQKRAVELCSDEFRKGHKAVVIVIPTGGGKSRLSAEIIARHLAKRPTGKALFCAHREELVSQAYDTLTDEGLSCGVIQAVPSRTVNPFRSTQIASTQTLVARELLVEGVTLVVLDECHHYMSDKWSVLGTEYKKRGAYIIGLSVGPASVIELRGGCFTQGYSGPIEAAFDIVSRNGTVEISGDYEIVKTAESGIESRGWMGTEFGWKPVNSFIRHVSDRDVMTLQAGGDSLVTTTDHSVYTVSEDFPEPRCVRADDIQVGDIVPIDNGANWGFGEIPIQVLDVVKNPNILVSVALSDSARDLLGLRKSPKAWWAYRNNSKFGHYLPRRIFDLHAGVLPKPTRLYTEGAHGHWVSPTVKLSDWAYMLGFWLGDGWFCENRISFAVAHAQLDDFLNEMNNIRWIGWKPHIRVIPNKGSVEVSYNNKLFVDFLISQLGIVKCYNKRIPGAWIVSWPETARRELIRGLLDSDGYRSWRHGNKERSYYTTVSPDLARGVLSLLRSLGVQGSIYSSPPSLGGVIEGRQIIGRRWRYNVHWSTNAYNGVNDGKRGARRRLDTAEYSYNEGVVRKAGSADTPDYLYDLEMQGHPSFVVGGVLVHNTATPIRGDGRGLGV